METCGVSLKPSTAHREVELDDRTRQLLLVRYELLSRRQDFLREKEEAEKKPEKRKAFCDKWYVDELWLWPVPGLHYSANPIVLTHKKGEHGVVLEVDLRYPKTAVIRHIKAEIDESYHIYHNRLTGYEHSDLERYNHYLQVWDLRKEEKSWGQIKRKLLLKNPQTARDYFNSAEKYIKKGLPQFPRFPQE